MSDHIFEFQLINGLQGDPAVYVTFKQRSEALLFDLGSLDALSNKELLRVRWVFVSHTHMDHFIGFDRLLRVNVPHRRLLQVWGPAPFLDKVQAKLRAYTWNLLDPDQIRFQVTEIHPDGRMVQALLSNADGFALHTQDCEQTLDHLVNIGDGARVQAVVLDHKGISSVAYRLHLPPRTRVDKVAMRSLGLEAGPWVGQLQRTGARDAADRTLTLQGRTWTLAALSEAILVQEPARSFVYLTDLSFDRRNLERLRHAFQPSSDLLSECSFADADVQRAVDKAHLTSRQSALIGQLLGVQNFHVFHVSGIYGQGPEKVAEEAQAFFAAYSPEQFASLVEAELLRCEALADKKG